MVLERLTAAQFQLRSPPGSPEPRHETLIPISLARCLPALRGLVRFRCPSTKLLASSSRSQTTIEPIRRALRSLHHRLPGSFSSRQTPLNLHRRFLTGGFLQTAVSDAPRTSPEIYLPLHMGRVRYSTNVSGKLETPPNRRVWLTAAEFLLAAEMALLLSELNVS